MAGETRRGWCHDSCRILRTRTKKSPTQKGPLANPYSAGIGSGGISEVLVKSEWFRADFCVYRKVWWPLPFFWGDLNDWVIGRSVLLNDLIVVGITRPSLFRSDLRHFFSRVW